MNWILDFDDTLAVGPNTWALTVILPELIAANSLPFDSYPKIFLTLSINDSSLNWVSSISANCSSSLR